MLHKGSLLLPISLILCSFLFFSCTEEKVLTDEEIDWLKQNDSLTVALLPYYPPYIFINEDSKTVGVFTEYMELIEQKINYKFKRKYYLDWPTMINDIRNENVDISLEIQSTETRNKYLNFYAEIFESKHVIVTRKNSNSGKRILDYKNKIITVPQEYAILENLERKYPNHNFAKNINDLVCLQKLNSGKYDAYIGPRAVANYIIKTENLDSLRIISETDFIYKPGISVNNKNQILNTIIKKAINNISDSEKNDIIENWLFAEITPIYKKKSFILLILLITIFVLAIILCVNFYLGFLVKQKTKELKIAKDAAEKDEKLKTAFIRNVSEEILTPITGIVNFSEALNSSQLTSTKRTKYTKIIKGSCEQLMDNIDNVLEISQIQTKQIILKKEEVDIRELLDTTLSFFKIKAEEKGISLILDNHIAEKDHTIIVDKYKLIKIINGIVRNSVRHTQQGAILISCTIQSSTLTITVRDSSTGIDLGDAKSILKSFSQSENQISKKYGEIGLGLITAKKNTDLMKGKLSFSSIQGKGSTFRIEIPFDKVNSSKKIISQNPTAIPHKKKNYITLIVEDGDVNFLFLKTLLLQLKDYNFVIHRAKTGKEAVDFCKENDQIDLILMDIKMPEMTGLDATRIIKKINPELLIIAQTAYSTKEDIQNTLEAGFDDFISKPIHQKTLKKVIKKHLENFENKN